MLPIKTKLYRYAIIKYKNVTKLNQNLQDKRDAIESEAKLHSLGFVEFVKNLTPEKEQMLKDTDLKNFIPWIAV